MFASKKLFGRLRSAKSHRNHRRIGRLESLEDRRMFNVDPHGGPVIPNVQVETLFFGHSWYSDPAMSQTAEQLNSYFSYLTGSSYMDFLSQYSTATQHIGHGTWVGGERIDRIVSPLGSLFIDDSEIRQMIDTEISHREVPQPNGNTVYMVYTDPNTEVTNSSGNSLKEFVGYHGSYSNDGRTVYYAVIPNPVGNAKVGNLTTFQQETEVASHELAEAVTDPVYPTGWFDSRYGVEGEIGDLANGDVVYLNNYAVQMEWSNQIGGRAAPAGATSEPVVNNPPIVNRPVVIQGGYTINTPPDDYTIDQPLVYFVDPSGNAPVGDYQAKINWGDQESSSGSISYDSVGGHYVVSGAHAYAGPSIYVIYVSVSHGNSQPSTAHTQISLVAPPPPPVVAPPVYVPPVVTPPVYVPPVVTPPVYNPPVTPPPGLTSNQEYVTAVYRAVLGTDPQPSELESWAAQLDGGLDRGAFVNSLDHSASYFATIIGPAYQQYLGRAADSAGLAYWIQQMQAGLTDEQLEAKFIGSPEFYQAAGGTDADWVEALYQHLLGRGADPQGEAWWTNALASGHSRSEVALEFTASSEREKQRVQDDYFHYLGRQASPSEADFWLNNFENGQTNEDLITGFLASPEYYQHHTS